MLNTIAIIIMAFFIGFFVGAVTIGLDFQREKLSLKKGGHRHG